MELFNDFLLLVVNCFSVCFVLICIRCRCCGCVRVCFLLCSGWKLWIMLRKWLFWVFRELILIMLMNRQVWLFWQIIVICCVGLFGIIVVQLFSFVCFSDFFWVSCCLVFLCRNFVGVRWELWGISFMLMNDCLFVGQLSRVLGWLRIFQFVGQFRVKFSLVWQKFCL